MEETLKTDTVEYGLIVLDEDSRKLSEDFRYAFSTMLSIGNTFLYNEASLGGYKSYICCTYDRTAAVKSLRSIGLRYKKNYVFAEDMFYLLDDWRDNPIAYRAYHEGFKGWVKSIIMGFAAKHRIVLPNNPHRDVLSGKYGEEADRKEGINSCIGRILDLVIYASILVIGTIEQIPQLISRRVLHKWYKYICFHTVSDAINYRNDYPVVADKIVALDELKAHTMASVYFKAVYFDRRQNSCGCRSPYQTIWIGDGGMTRLCDCPEFLDVGVGAAGLTECDRIWNSPLAEIIRLSVINNTYTFCSRRLCGVFRDYKDSYELIDRKRIDSFVNHPSKMIIANDCVCNLHCPSCRNKEYVRNTDGKTVEIEACAQALNESSWLDKADNLILGGGGETFISKYYMGILCGGQSKRDSIVIMTNGTLFTERVWNMIVGKYEHISIMVSVDAATKETYEKVRCGGDFDRLTKNMLFLSDLKKEKKVDTVIVNMIVQNANYKEIPAFIAWALEMGFDEVNLSHIRNWGTYSRDEFENIVSMFDRNGNMKSALADVLKDPICSDPIVNMKWSL